MKQECDKEILKGKLDEQNQGDNCKTPEELLEIKEISVQTALACEYRPGCDCSPY